MSEFWSLDPEPATARAFAEDEIIFDPGEAYVVAYAAKPYFDELATNRDKLTADESFRLGMQAGRAMVAAQLQYDPNAAPDELEASAEALPEADTVLVDELAVRAFASESGYTPRTASLALRKVMEGDTYYPDGHPLSVLLEQFRRTARENDKKLDVLALKEILHFIVVDNDGYVRDINKPTIAGLGVGSISFLADFVNRTLELDGESQLPLGRAQ